MTALYTAGAASNYSPAQVEALVFFWDLPNKTPEEIRVILKNRLYLSDHLIEQFI
jgi:hypothetical protein